MESQIDFIKSEKASNFDIGFTIDQWMAVATWMEEYARDQLSDVRDCKCKQHDKITCLLTYWKYIEPAHAMLDGTRVKSSIIVEVDNLTDLNEKYDFIDVKVLK